MKRLVLFDIDGTLLWTDGAGRTALKFALEQVYATPGILENFDPGGRTIKEIVEAALADYGVAPETIREKHAEYERVMQTELIRLIESGDFDIRPCPGAPELVAAVDAHPEAVGGLLTGNPETSAIPKLKAAGYDPSILRVRAFGDESRIRSELVHLALERAAIHHNESFTPEQVVLIGDTHRDVAAAHQAGARCIAVETGDDDHSTLAAAHADYIFTDLSDTQAVLTAVFA